MPTTEPTRCGFVALLGAPNVGKSTLVNALVGQKVSIVTQKVQTTRIRVRGIAVESASQLVLVDTPGIFRAPKTRLERAMVAAAWEGAADADATVLLVDAARGVDANTRTILDELARRDTRAILALNKVDAVKRETLLTLAAELDATGRFDATFMISALTGDGVGDLKAHLAAAMPTGPWLYPEDEITDLPSRLLAAEITREKAFLRLHQELPYALNVMTDTLKRQRDGAMRVEQTLTVARDSQKPIVLGRGGQTIKTIREQAQADMAALFDRPVHLFIHVRVREKWAEDAAHYRELGLKYDV